MQEGMNLLFSSTEDIMSNVEWFILMVYMLDWNRYFTFAESILGASYPYAHKFDKIRDVSYTVEGYLLLGTFAIKAVKHIYAQLSQTSHNSKQAKSSDK